MGICASARISTRRVAATGSARNSRSETWIVIVNSRGTSAPATSFSTCLGLRTAACFFGALSFAGAFLGAALVFFGAALVFFGAVLVVFAARVDVFETAFWGAVFFPSTAALTSRLLCWRGFLSGRQAPSLICLSRFDIHLPSWFTSRRASYGDMAPISRANRYSGNGSTHVSAQQFAQVMLAAVTCGEDVRLPHQPSLDRPINRIG